MVIIESAGLVVFNPNDIPTRLRLAKAAHRYHQATTPRPSHSWDDLPPGASDEYLALACTITNELAGGTEWAGTL